MWNEVRLAFRSLYKARGFTVAAIAVIALCIAANTAIFGVVNTVLWKPMSFSSPERLVSISERMGAFHSAGGSFSAPDYLFLEGHSRSFASIAAYNTREWELSGVAIPDRVTGSRVTASLFSTLGAAPQLGRTFTADEDTHSQRVAVLSDRYWRNAFGASPEIAGSTIYLDREPYTVIGVMPPAFVFPLRHAGSNGVPADVYVPMSWTPLERQFGYMVNKGVIARLNPGVTVGHAAAEVNAIMKRAEAQYPPGFRSQPDFALSGIVVPYSRFVTGNLQTIMLVLLSAAGLVLLIGCANVANLLLARSLQRRREFAVRCALGAGKLQIVRQTLVESFLLSCTAGVLGVIFAAWLSPQLVRRIPLDVPRLNEIALDWHALLFALIVCCLMPLLFGLAPAFEASRVELSHVLRENGRSGTQSRRQRRWMSIAVVAQYGLAVLLLVTAGLLMRSFLRLRQVNPGFERQNVLTMGIKLPAASYKTAPQISSFYNNLIRELRILPGVEKAGAISDLPLKPSDEWGVAIEGKGPQNGVPPSIQLSWVAGDGLQTIRVKLLSGRLLQESDGPDAPGVVVINESLARQAWPNENPVGKRIGLGGLPSSESGWKTVVGVIADVRQGLSNQDTKPQIFETLAQANASMMSGNSAVGLRNMHIVLRTTTDPVPLIATARTLIARQDPALPVTEIQTLDQYVSESIHSQRFDTYLVGTFAALALLLSLVGIAGVLSYTVAQRRAELGIRMALGGTVSNIAGLVFTDGLKLAGAGILLGLGSAFAAGRFLSSLLYQTSSFDPLTFALVPLALAATTIAASLIPAWRAARIDPMTALRTE